MNNQAVVNGHADAGAELAQEKDADADVVEDMKGAKIEDGKPAVAGAGADE